MKVWFIRSWLGKEQIPWPTLSAGFQPHVRRCPSSRNDGHLQTQVQKIMSVSTTWCDVLASALFQGPLPGGGGRSPSEPFEDCLRLTLLLNTLLSPQRILGCKWFPAAFAENGSLPCELLVELLYLVSGGWVHQYLKATKAKSSQICQFASFEGRYENFLTFPFVSWASFFFPFFLYFLFLKQSRTQVIVTLVSERRALEGSLFWETCRLREHSWNGINKTCAPPGVKWWLQVQIGDGRATECIKQAASLHLGAAPRNSSFPPEFICISPAWEVHNKTLFISHRAPQSDRGFAFS